jgi:hypothetical protein
MRSRINLSISPHVASVDHFFSQLLDELSSAVLAFEPLFTLVDVTLLKRLGRCTNGAGGIEGEPAETLLLLHYTLNPTQTVNAFTS